MPAPVTTLTLRDLEYLAAVGELKHFGRAALKCHVSQPTLSAQIRKVEETLGARVFERTNRQVSVTAVGEEILRQARVVLDEARKLPLLARGRQETLAGPLRLGAIATLGPYYLPYLLGPLRRRYPRLELLLTEGLTDSLIRQLREGELDAVLASPTFADDGLRAIPLFFEPFHLAAPAGHPLATRKPLRGTDLRPSEMVLLEDGHCLKDQAISFCPVNRRGGTVRNFHATSVETLRHLVASGLGYTLMPGLAVTASDRLRDLVRYRRFDGPEVGRNIVLYCRARSAQLTDLDALAELIRKNLPPGTRIPG